MIPKHILQSRLLVTGPWKDKAGMPGGQVCALVAVSGHQHVCAYIYVYEYTSKIFYATGIPRLSVYDVMQDFYH